MKNTFIFLTVIFSCALVYAQKPYRGAEYRSIDSYEYGRFEARIKYASGAGVVSSFFTIKDYWAEGLSDAENWREIDFEALGNQPDIIQTNVISAYENHHEQIHDLSHNVNEDYHLYAIEWTPSYIKFYVNNQLVRYDANDYVETFNTGQKIMMNIWQPIWEDWVGVFDESLLPIYAFYDYIKYYSYTPGYGTYGTGNNFTLEWVDELTYFDQERWEKATHTWWSNNAQFVEENAVLLDGYLILCLTDNSTSGYSGDSLEIMKIKQIPMVNPTIYPNPFNSSFTIHLPKFFEDTITHIRIIDQSGRVVLSTKKFKMQDRRLQISFGNNTIASGIYFGIITIGGMEHSFKTTYIK